MAVHWSKIEDGPYVMVESHVPPYLGNEELAGSNKEKIIGLFADDEASEAIDESDNVWTAESYAEREAELMAEYRDREE